MREDTIQKLTDGSLVSENRVPYLIRTGRATPRFLQGVFPFVGRGIVDLGEINHELTYEVPKGKLAEALYIRAGNSSEALIYIALIANGKPIRYVPLGPSGTEHIPLAIVESFPAGTILQVWIGAPKNLTGMVVIDIGFIEIAS